ncbi:Acetylornithine deacetylase [Trichostrongylus colubriformis]|uniref:Acetylornithine deacetylase n=1 Tax=Trichostrongylus colubriformis TaxID=6319 RepID=A0AAN8IU32_TRICO
MDLDDVEKLLLTYMRIESTTGCEGPFGDLVAQSLEENGWVVEKQPVNHNSSRFNILATRKSLKEATPRIVFNTHLDTVPPYIPPKEDDLNIYGRGSNDAKGQLACMVSAAQALVKSHPDVADQLALLFVVGEEVDHVGMKKANDLLHLEPDYLVVGEPTELKFATIQKGALKARLRCQGVAGHSGYPSEGKSAIHMLVPILNDILNFNWPSDPEFGATTVNIGFIEGGQALNAWAENASAQVFLRVTTSAADAQQKLESVVAGRAMVEVMSYNDPVVLSKTPLDYPTEQVAFNTDLPYYNRLSQLKGKYLFGAGSIKNAHSQHEFMPKKELHCCKDALINLALNLCST